MTSSTEANCKNSSNNNNNNSDSGNNNNSKSGKQKEWDVGNKKSSKQSPSPTPDFDNDDDDLPPPPPPLEDDYYGQIILQCSDNASNHHHHHHHHHMSGVVAEKEKNCRKSSQDKSHKLQHSSSLYSDNGKNYYNKHLHTKSSRAESVLSSDSDIRFTRRKLGDNQKCGCALIAGFLLTLLFAGAIVYIGYTYLRPDPLPDRTFRARLRVIEGDAWTPELADQNTPKFRHRAKDYRELINLIIRRSDLREPYEGSEILALDGNEGEDLTVHFAMHFDPYIGLVSAGDLHAILMEEIVSEKPRFFKNITIDPNSLVIKEVLGQMDDIPGTSSAPLGGTDDLPIEIVTTQRPPRKCEPLKLNYCKTIGYNTTTYPNYLDHNSIDEVEADVIAFRELVDGECFRQAFDFVCRLLQPPCEIRDPFEPSPGQICRHYCQAFVNGCGERLPERFKKFLDCERFPESTGIQTCHNRPGCSSELQANALSSRLCDGVADCPDMSDESQCTFCPYGAIHCGRGRSCVQRSARCDGRIDCPDGSDEKDCLSISPLVSYMTNPQPIVPHRPRFYNEGFAVFTEKGSTGKLCAEGMEANHYVRSTVAESLCKALGYEQVEFSEIRNDTEPNMNFVKVLDPRASEISFIRTQCVNREALYVSCKNLECGVQSALPGNFGNSLPKMATSGDWPWHVALFRAENHVCDGTLISSDWVLTTESCFQGQSKATWIAVFGAIRLSSSNAPWTQRRRIIGMVKSPVEGSTAALVRLETPIIFSDFVRPICLPDLPTKEPTDQVEMMKSENIPTPHAEKYLYVEGLKRSEKRSRKLKEYRQYFETPQNQEDLENLSSIGESAKYSRSDYVADFVDESSYLPKAEAINTQVGSRTDYPLPDNSPQTKSYANNMNYANVHFKPKTSLNQWTNCNTLGWSRQRDHLQRVQLKIGDMKTCENVSIATVNSMCAESAYQKPDCSEEEFAGSPVMCLFPNEKRWALIGIASWRIACAPSGVERPRMYDKITSNTQWIRETIAASIT